MVVVAGADAVRLGGENLLGGGCVGSAPLLNLRCACTKRASHGSALAVASPNPTLSILLLP